MQRLKCLHLAKHMGAWQSESQKTARLGQRCGITLNYDGFSMKHVLCGNKRQLADVREELMQAVKSIILKFL